MDKPERKPDETGKQGTGGAPAAPPETETKTYAAIEQVIADEGGATNDPEYTPGEKPEPPPGIGRQELAALYQMVFGVVASRRGAHWNLNATEAGELGKATDAVIQKYAPGANLGVEGALVLTAAAITVPRIMADMQNQEKPEPAPAQNREGATDGDQRESE